MKNNKKSFIDDLEQIKISEIELARSVIDTLPDIREDKVRKLKEKYKDPNFEVDWEEVADKILESYKK